MLLFIICSRRSWILDSKRLYSVGTGLVSAGTAAPGLIPAPSQACPGGILPTACLSPHTREGKAKEVTELCRSAGRASGAGNIPAAPNPTTTSHTAAQARAAVTSTAAELQFHEGMAGQDLASC